MQIIGLSGWGKSGKDTVGTFLAAHGFKRYAFADKLKECLVALNPVIGLNPKNGKPVTLQAFIAKHNGLENCKHHPEITRLLQRLGTEAGREVLGEDVWVNAVAAQIASDSPERVVITDLRFPNEVTWIEAQGGFLWRINRKGNKPKTNSEGKVHKSEILLDDHPFDVVFNNDSTLQDLKAEVDSMVQIIFGGDIERKQNEEGTQEAPQGVSEDEAHTPTGA